MIFEAILSVKILIFNNLIILSESTKLSKPRRDFLVEIMLLFLGIKGKLNFLQFGRFGKFGEQRYRQQYLCTEKPTGKRGRPKKFAGKIDLKNIDKSYFTLLDSNDEYTVYEAIVNSKSLEQSIKSVYVELKKVTSDFNCLL